MKRAITAVLVAVVAGGFIIPAATASDERVIRTPIVGDIPQCSTPGPDRQLSKLGPLRVNTGPTLGKARRRLGEPHHIRRRDVGGWPFKAVAVWKGRFAARMTFYSYGGATNHNDLWLQVARLTGRGWMTRNGVHVGSTLRQVRARFGEEAWRFDGSRNWWRLAGQCTPPGEVSEWADTAVLSAHMKAGRVHFLSAFVGAAGE